jgi:phosphohistidine phosphatase
MAAFYVVRHAVAENRDPERWPDDSKRPLTADGAARFRRTARGLRKLVPPVDLVLSSPYSRAWRTAELLTEEAGWPSPVECEAFQAERAPEEAAAVVRAHAGAESLAVVGHEPQLSQLVSVLLTGSASAVRLALKKGSVTHLDVADERAVLHWLATPKTLRRL